MRENLAFYNHEASDEDMTRALAAVGLEGLLAALPEDLDTRLGEGGRVVSGGQAQRIALCRALLDPARDVWVLDEPTAHLDEQTEREVHEMLRALMHGKTAFVATHSAVWEEGADVIARMDAAGGEAS